LSGTAIALVYVGELVIRMLNVMTGEVQTDPRKTRTFDAKAFLDSPGMAGQVADYRPAEILYSQGDPSDTLLYIQHGTVKLTVVSPTGREAVVGMLGAGEFLGERALAGQPVRVDTATAMTVSRIRVVPKGEMIRLLHQQSALSDRFIAHLLARNNRLESDLVDQLFNACEKRLARTLLMLARNGKPDRPRHGLPAISQEVLAEMVGTTRSRVNVFMNKFRKLGFVDYNKDGVTVHHTLLRVVLHESPASDHRPLSRRSECGRRPCPAGRGAPRRGVGIGGVSNSTVPAIPEALRCEQKEGVT
jgi:CRP-like cAMP-binding protein